MPTPRRIGVLSGGGDCPGINAVIRAVTLDAIATGIEVIGIRDGFLGLIQDRLAPLQRADVEDILTRGGSILGCSNKANPAHFAVGKDSQGRVQFADVTPKCLDIIRRERLDALVCIGGDGTMTCAQSLADPAAFGHTGPGVNCIGVPKTIDNDIVGTDLTFGFLTAVSIAADALDRVRTTAESHGRVLAVELMGRNAGWLALHAGLASGTDAILLPEIEFDLDALADRLRQRHRAGEPHAIICVAEGARPKGGSLTVARIDPTSPDPIKLGGVAKFVADALEARTGLESRHVVLGHVQRGGTPVAADRVLATRFGHAAMQLIHAGTPNRMVAWQQGRVTDIPIAEPAGRQRRIAPGEPLIAAARALGVFVG